MFDDCRLHVTIDEFIKKIHMVLEENFNPNIYFGNYLEHKKNMIMILDRDSGKVLFRERCISDRNKLKLTRMEIVHYFLQIAVWVIYNSLIDQPNVLNDIFNNFYDYMFGPILSSIIFSVQPLRRYVSEVPSIYLELMPILTTSSYSQVKIPQLL